MTETLRDQLMGLGFKPAPAPEKPRPGQPRSDKTRPDHSTSEKRGNGKPSRTGPGHARRDERGPRSRGADAARNAPNQRGGPRANETPRDERRRSGGGEMDLAKAYAIRSQTEKNERIAAEKERQELAQQRREGKLKLAELLKTTTLNDKDAEIARHFEYGGKIRRVYVTQEQLRALNAGELAVVQQGGRFFIVTPDHARAAEVILAGALALLVDPAALADDDPYANPLYQVPDDLVW